MKCSCYVSLSLKNIKRDKRNLFSISMLVLALLLILSYFMLQESFQNYEQELQEILEYRQIILPYNNIKYSETEITEKISAIPNITNIYPKEYDKQYASLYMDESNEMIYFKIIDTVEMKRLLGRELKDNEIILPKKIESIIDDKKIEKDTSYLKEKDAIIKKDILKEINEYIEEKNTHYSSTEVIGNKEYIFQVAGFYEKEETTDNNACFINLQTAKKIYKDCIVDQKVAEEICITVNTFSNTKKVWNQLEKEKLVNHHSIVMVTLEEGEIPYNTNFYAASQMSKATIDIIGFLSAFAAVIFSIIGIFTILFVQMKKAKEKEEEIGILKTEGYTKRNIQILNLIESIEIVIFSFMIAIVLIQLFQLGLSRITPIVMENVNGLDNYVEQQIIAFLKMPKVIHLTTYWYILFTTVIISLIITMFTTNQTARKEAITILKK